MRCIQIGVLLSFMACSSKVVIDNPTAEQRFHMGMEEFKNGNFLEAIQHFEVIRMQFPASPVADSSKYYAGFSRFNREEYLLGQYEFSQLIQNNPKSPLIPDSYFMYAECLYKLSPKASLDQTNTTKAIDALQTFLEVYPSHPKAQEAATQMTELVNKLAEKEYKTALLYIKMENNTSALVYLNNVIDRYYNTPYAPDAMVTKLRILVKRKSFTEAGKLADTLLEKYPDSSHRSEVEDLRKTIAAGQTTENQSTRK